MVRAMATMLQQRLNRGLLEVEWQLLSRVVDRFVRDTLPPGRTEDLAAEIYLRHFDAAKLRQLIATPPRQVRVFPPCPRPHRRPRVSEGAAG